MTESSSKSESHAESKNIGLLQTVPTDQCDTIGVFEDQPVDQPTVVERPRSKGRSIGYLVKASTEKKFRRHEERYARDPIVRSDDDDDDDNPEYRELTSRLLAFLGFGLIVGVSFYLGTISK